MLTPESYAKPNSEHSQQVSLFMWSANEIRERRLIDPNDAIAADLEWMFAVPNGGERHINVAANMKAEGVKKGVADICLPSPRAHYHGMFIEMKRPEPPGEVSEHQQKFLTTMQRRMYYVVVCWTWIEARNAILAYLNLR